MAIPTASENIASTTGPRLSELTPLTRDVSEAIAELKPPTEFSLKSNHPIP